MANVQIVTQKKYVKPLAKPKEVEAWPKPKVEAWPESKTAKANMIASCGINNNDSVIPQSVVDKIADML